MSKIVVIGDVHGATGTYQKIVRRLPPGQRSIQLGDMGIGFHGVGLHRMPPEHGWFRGNHDNPSKCRENPNYMGDWGLWPDDRLFWMAGANSIDRAHRIQGVSWWPDEELSYTELDKVFAAYVAAKPRFMVTHEAPRRAAVQLLHGLLIGFNPDAEHSSRTAEALQQMYDAWQPEIWVFGHYHVDKEFQIDDRTKFRCVGELRTYEL